MWKYAMGYEKNMSFLVINKISKIWEEKKLKIQMYSFNYTYTNKA